MSHSTLYGIRGDLTGEVLCEYVPNSWLFVPVIWTTLYDKYVGDQPFVSGIMDSDIAWHETNGALNNSGDMADRICWELAAQQLFFTRDKRCIADAIRRFAGQNKGYHRSREDGMSALEREHVVGRFVQVAADIDNLDESEYPYFVFKGTSCDDSVECWFSRYDEATDEYVETSLVETRNCGNDFVRIEGGDIVGWTSVGELLESEEHARAMREKEARMNGVDAGDTETTCAKAVERPSEIAYRLESKWTHVTWECPECGHQNREDYGSFVEDEIWYGNPTSECTECGFEVVLADMDCG